jgi:hypothetical protein
LHEEFRRRISQDPDGATIGGHDGDVVLALLASGRVEMRKADTWQILAEKPSDKIIDLVA